MTAGAVAVADELDVLLEEAGKQGYLWYLFRTDHHGPEVLAGVLQRLGCADVLVLSGVEHAHAYRVLTGPDTDVFAPRDVLWWYGANPVWTLRGLLTLPEPGHPEAPTTLTPAPPGSGVSGDRRPARLRRRGH
jgi:hypothetical protein